MKPSLKETAEYRPRIGGDRLHVSLSDHQRVKRKQQIVMAQGLILGELQSYTTLYQTSAALILHIDGDLLSMNEPVERCTRYTKLHL